MQTLSLAAKAGKITAGSFGVEKSVKSEKARLVILAKDASDNTKKKFSDACRFRDIPCAEYSDADSLGHQIGKEARVVLAVEDAGFAASVMKNMDAVL